MFIFNGGAHRAARKTVKRGKRRAAPRFDWFRYVLALSLVALISVAAPQLFTVAERNDTSIVSSQSAEPVGARVQLAQGNLPPTVAAVVVDGYQLMWSTDPDDFLGGEPFVPGITVPNNSFYVFLSPQQASSVTWNSDDGVRVYSDDGYPWREKIKVSRLGAGDHVLSVTVDAKTTIEVPFTLGRAQPATTSPTVASGVTATSAVTATTSAALAQVSYVLTWSTDGEDFLGGEPFTAGITVPNDSFYVFLAPQQASSVTWNSDNGVRVYSDDGYPWRERIKVSRLGGGDHVLSVTVDGKTTFTVPFTLGSSGVVASLTPTTEPKVTTTTTSRPAATTTTTKPKATTTTTKPKTTVTTKPVSGVAVRAGESIQAAVDKHPGGTTFVIKAGVHKRQSVVPNQGNTFVGEPGAVLSGENVTEFAFRGGGGDDVTIRGLVIEKYATPLREGVVQGGNASHGWLVEDNEIRYNGGVGVKSSAGWRVVDNYIHHNQQFGLTGAGKDMLIEGNEIAFNNYQSKGGGDAGGTKWVHSTNLVVRNNYSHDNKGAGLHTDGNNVNTLYEGNRVENNAKAGIKHEVSCDAVIRNNTAIGNGFGNSAWIAGAGILVMNSPDVEVYGNVVRNNNDGIGGIHSGRSHSTDQRCKIELRNFWVHDNTIEMTAGHTGIVSNLDGGEVFTSMNNRFDRNTYTLHPASGSFYKWGGTKTTAQWKATGQDKNSTWK